MEIIKKTYNIKKLDGSINIPVLLTQKYDNIGLLTDVSDSLEQEEITVIITGTTDNRLAEIRSFDYDNPYKIGINNVTDITSDQIKYSIDGIDYITDLPDNKTTFIFSVKRYNYIKNNFISDDTIFTLADKVDVLDNVFIERQDISIVEHFSKIRQIGSVSEINTFSNGFYKIINQTI